MSAWGKNGAARSCESLLNQVENNEPNLKECVILPLKTFGSIELLRLASILESGQNTHLRSLQASGHNIDDPVALEALGRALVPSSSAADADAGANGLETLCIGDSNMGDDGICALCQGFESKFKFIEENSRDSLVYRLKGIDLSYKNIGPKGLTAAILQIFSRVLSLQDLNLSRNEKIGPFFDFFNSIPSISLPLFPSLTHLDLSECLLDAKSCTTLLQAMQPISTGPSSGKTTRNLILRLNSSDLSNSHDVKDMMSLLTQSCLVSELYVSRCQIGDEGIQVIVDECCRSSNEIIDDDEIHRLDLSYNDISSTGINYLANRLHMSSNDIKTTGRHYFSNIRVLNLAGNPLNKKMIDAIECNVQWMSTLKELDVSHTSCGISAAVEIIRRSNSVDSSLKILNLFGNQLGTDDGFLEISKHLQGGHYSIEYLDIGGNEAEESGVVSVVAALKNVPQLGDENEQNTTTKEAKRENTLRTLVVGGNKGGSTLEVVVNEVLQIHPMIDIARDKPKQNTDNDNSMIENSAFDNKSGTAWTS
jgi:Ran GTPase-activating protein (RanGAP) involved in mRNA processing and transport